jgi:putative sterol carrier protein
MQQDLASALPERRGATARIQYRLTDAPGGDRAFFWVMESGRFLECKTGEDPHADVTLMLSYQDGVKIARLELDESFAFMQGRLKAKGNLAKLMSVMPVAQSPEYRAVKAQVKEMTQF